MTITRQLSRTIQAPRFFTVLAVALIAMTGCGYDSKMKSTMMEFDQGKFSAAATQIAPLLAEYSLQDANKDGKSDSPINGVVFYLDGGTIQQAAAQYPASLATYESVWNEISPYLVEKAETKVTEELAAAMTNQTIRTYRGTGVDRIMLNTYQSLNYFALGQPEKAAVELRRAQNWQADLVKKNQARIDADTKAFEESGKKNGYDANKSLDDPGFQASLNANYGTIREMRGYSNYEIPYATYLRAVNRFATGQFEQARTTFKRVAEMLPAPANADVLKDVEMAGNAANGQTPSQCVYVFVEAGRAPSLKELRLDIPLFIAGVPYVGAAFPLLEIHNEPSVTGFTVTAADAVANAALLTDMDAVVAQDFNQRLPGIIMATLVSSASKAAATYGLQQGMGNWGSIIGAVYQVGANSADLRCWLTLPKRVLWCRVNRPESGTISITMSDGKTIGPVQIPAATVTVIRVRTVNAGTDPAVMSFAIASPG
ncbi:MAG: hypothetical protein EXS12_07925 [Phycisphaerales bacterium]|nr:hypothetical protein [Phycisphaerales bacterium]